jgi:hypothetical protein
MSPMKSYLSVKQVVARLNGFLSAKLIYVLLAKGRLRVNRILRKPPIEEDSLISVALMRGYDGFIILYPPRTN